MREQKYLKGLLNL